MVLDRAGRQDSSENREQSPVNSGLESLTGANHPLSKPTDSVPNVANADNGFNPKSVTEVITDASGQQKDDPLQKGPLPAGDHTLQFENGRQFVVHIPNGAGNEELPVMFVIAPSVHTNQGYDAKNFEIETGMNQYADQHKFVVVYALPKQHLLGVDSKTPAEAWNAPGTGIDQTDLKHAGYNDEDYIKSIADLMPQLANVDSSHKDWGAITFSQGALLLNQLSHDIPNLFPTVGLVGSTFEIGHNYATAPGDAKNVMLVNLHGDDNTFPFPGEEGFEYKAEKALADRLNFFSSLWADGKHLFGGAEPHSKPGTPPEGWGTDLAERLDPLGAIDNRDQNPVLEEELYKHDIESAGPYSIKTTELSTPVDSTKKDSETLIQSEQTPDRLAIYDLTTAMHSWPGPDHQSHVNATPQYTEFDTSRTFATQFESFNEAEKAKAENEK